MLANFLRLFCASPCRGYSQDEGGEEVLALIESLQVLYRSAKRNAMPWCFSKVYVGQATLPTGSSEPCEWAHEKWIEATR